MSLQHVEGETKKRKRKTNTTREQYELYLNLMEQDYTFRSGTINPTMGDNYLEKKWNDLCTILNALGSGPGLSADDWKKRFVDWKNTTRSKARKILFERNKTGGGEECSLKLNDLEERGLAVWGKVTITGSPDVPVSGGLQNIETESFSNNCDVTDVFEDINDNIIEIIQISNNENNNEAPRTKLKQKKSKNSLQEKAQNLSENYEKNVNLMEEFMKEFNEIKKKNYEIEEKKVHLENRKLNFEIAKYKHENEHFMFDQ